MRKGERSKRSAECFVVLVRSERSVMRRRRRGCRCEEREEKNSVAIASNESFSGWTKTFTDPRLCAVIVDRLTFGGNIIETGTNSCRLAHTKTTNRSPEQPRRVSQVWPSRIPFSWFVNAATGD